MLRRTSTAIFIFFTLFLLTSLSVATHAANYSSKETACDPDGTRQKIITKDFGGTNLNSTHATIAYSSITDTIQRGMIGAGGNDHVACMQYYKTLPEMRDLIPSDFPNCGSYNEDVCKSIINSWDTGQKSTDTVYNLDGVSARGSALGLAYIVQKGMTEAPPPVSLALYWNDSIKNVPFAGKAMAATVNYNQMLLPDILDVWKVTRNLALALIAIILMITGIMISLRKKINQQVVVNFQYAIPKLVICVGLIFFSYPIGAVITSLAWTLYFSGFALAKSLGLYFNTESLIGGLGGTSISFGGVVSLIIAAMSASGAISAAPFVGLVLAVISVIMVIMFVWAILKAFIVYLKMIFSIITAPLEFAIAAIPGSDSKILDWFKKMAVYLVTLALMGMSFWIVLRVGANIAFSSNSNWVGGVLLSLLGGPFIVVYGLGFTIGMEKRVEGFIIGQQKQKR